MGVGKTGDEKTRNNAHKNGGGAVGAVLIENERCRSSAGIFPKTGFAPDGTGMVMTISGAVV